ncbi:hypothetical protein KQX54_001042 [Cotesia glomerata]|uniref:Uncharacterized protein n=1 Tax=Cotesia glomerata TaxID=32391 RepID=A0AAV7J155_COTGL|nr:hypothetical protein KQX54_001042 [Cotesia glomerata]
MHILAVFNLIHPDRELPDSLYQKLRCCFSGAVTYSLSGFSTGRNAAYGLVRESPSPSHLHRAKSSKPKVLSTSPVSKQVLKSQPLRKKSNASTTQRNIMKSSVAKRNTIVSLMFSPEDDMMEYESSFSQQTILARHRECMERRKSLISSKSSAKGSENRTHDSELSQNSSILQETVESVQLVTTLEQLSAMPTKTKNSAQDSSQLVTENSMDLSLSDAEKHVRTLNRDVISDGFASSTLLSSAETTIISTEATAVDPPAAEKTLQDAHCCFFASESPNKRNLKRRRIVMHDTVVMPTQVLDDPELSDGNQQVEDPPSSPKYIIKETSMLKPNPTNLIPLPTSQNNGRELQHSSYDQDEDTTMHNSSSIEDNHSNERINLDNTTSESVVLDTQVADQSKKSVNFQMQLSPSPVKIQKKCSKQCAESSQRRDTIVSNDMQVAKLAKHSNVP